MAMAAVSTGNAMMTRKLVTSMFQVKIGTRNMTMPGARSPNTVVTRLMAVNIPENPVSATPMIHRSAPGPGEWIASLSGAYANQPKFAAPLEVKKPETMTNPPPR